MPTPVKLQLLDDPPAFIPQSSSDHSKRSSSASSTTVPSVYPAESEHEAVTACTGEAAHADANSVDPNAAEDRARMSAQAHGTEVFRGAEGDASGSPSRRKNAGEEELHVATSTRATPLVPDGVRLRNGAIAPRPLCRSQFRAAPTGGSDSDTDNGSSSPSRSSSHHSPSARGSAGHTTDNAPAVTAEEEEDERQFVDEFGFVIDEDERTKDEQFIKKIDGKQVVRREIKWANMAANWARTNNKMHAKLKERCRKGIPSRFRGVAWQLLINSRVQMDSPANAGVYAALRDKVLLNKEVDPIISRDLARTFPNHIFFQEQHGIGQTLLRNVLHAYAGSDPEVGYVQGMGFIVGTLSTQMGEEEAFWALHEMMYSERYKMRELFKPGFPLLQQFFYQLKRLLARLLPKLSKRFEQLGVEPSFYASQWFLTLFVYHFPFRALLRIWDIFFSEGWKIIFRVGIALMKWEEKRLLSLPFEELLPVLKNLQDGKDASSLMHRAHRIKFKTAELNRYGDEYWASIGFSPLD